eukprot:IDg8010t1
MDELCSMLARAGCARKSVVENAYSMGGSTACSTFSSERGQFGSEQERQRSLGARKWKKYSGSSPEGSWEELDIFPRTWKKGCASWTICGL